MISIIFSTISFVFLRSFSTAPRLLCVSSAEFQVENSGRLARASDSPFCRSLFKFSSSCFSSNVRLFSRLSGHGSHSLWSSEYKTSCFSSSNFSSSCGRAILSRMFIGSLLFWVCAKLCPKYVRDIKTNLKISKSIKIQAAPKKGAFQRNSIIFYTLAFFAASYTRVKSEIQVLYRPPCRSLRQAVKDAPVQTALSHPRPFLFNSSSAFLEELRPGSSFRAFSYAFLAFCLSPIFSQASPKLSYPLA